MNLIFNYEEISKRLNEYNNTPHNGYKCGLQSFDDIIRMDKSTLAICAAKPNNGKSTFVNYYAYLMAKAHQWRTMYFCFETSTNRQINEMVGLFGSQEETAKHCIFTEDIKTVEEVFKCIDEAQNLDMVVIDPFTNFMGMSNTEINTNNIGRILSRLQAIAKQKDILVLVTAHPTKLKDDEQITMYSICGSNNFANMADYIFSIDSDFKEHTTTIKALKIRENGDKGNVGAQCTLNFNRINKTYQDGKETIDVILDTSTKVEASTKGESSTKANEPMTMEELRAEMAKAVKQVMAERKINKTIETPPTYQDRVKHTTNITPTIRANVWNTKVSYFPNMFGSEHTEITLKEALEMGKDNGKIDELRTIDKGTNYEAYNKIKCGLPCFTPCCKCKANSKEMEAYTKIIAIDIDKQDNEAITIEEMKEKAKSLPYVFYISKSVGGKGIFCLVNVIGDYTQHKKHYEALKDDFAKVGLVIDKVCSNINRFRIISKDENPYINNKAIIYTKTKEPPTRVHNTTPREFKANVGDNGNLSEIDKANFIAAVKDIQDNNLEITKNHAETLDLCKCMVCVFGEDGREYAHLFRAQRNGYDEAKTDNTFNDCLNYMEASGNTYTIATFWKYYNKAKAEKK